ncbi:sugar phosphate isomerase/epimerase family protein [Staphylococcus equorum]|uniref:sugar phosphate isomerase/epimerase family protein n=1 Tax=Staphylococcus equorum TaxID=246432 RepID=UPI000A4FA52A|nr:sugar phosphate isomerase/epimerase family protein [Staphylococcus equorum]
MREYGLCLWSFGNAPFKRKCKIAKNIGVDGVEVEGNLDQNPIEIKNILDEYNLKPLSVTPANVDISSSDKNIREKAVAYFLDLLDWAKELDTDRICVHGDVGKVKGSEDKDLDWDLLVSSTKTIVEKARRNNILVVFEVLNRYENHQIVTCKEALDLIKEVNSSNLSILLDSYHMNIEEKSPSEAIKSAGNKLGVYHVADSNRQQIGDGHSNIKEQIKTLHSIDYKGPIIMEMVAQGPNPFTPEKELGYIEVLSEYYKNSLKLLKKWDFK